jgi:hypothetical protein
MGLVASRRSAAVCFASLCLAACTTREAPPDAYVPDAPAIVMPDAGPPCSNGVRDGTETHVDCGGGACPACEDGRNCLVASDCESGVCGRGYCLVPSCRDMVRNGLETGVDCGGDCGRCPGGQPCAANADCISGRCVASVCEPSSCEDRRMNDMETDVDCGGPTCDPCTGGDMCRDDSDCDSFFCDTGECSTASCTDRIQNQDESSVDCGGTICNGCRDGLGCGVDGDCLGMRCVDGGCVSCMDRIRNAEETDVDCGGGLCPGCPDLDMCAVDSDCTGMRCEAGVCTSCVDLVRNGDETDVDCGGTLCPRCADRRMCGLGSDCASGRCVDFVCISCTDGIRNADETDVDCGGTTCAARCAPTRMCVSSSDCASMICSMGRCNAPGCGDGIRNGAETDLDCGGGMCLGCAVGQMCVLGRDCVSGVCTGGLCQAPSCTDGVANGLETDIDCGGSSTCPRCADGRLCPNGPSDCISPLCTSGRCGDVRGHLVLIGHDYFSRNAGIDQVAGNAVLLAPETGIIDVLVYDEFADRSASGEVANLQTAITAELTAISRTVRFTRLTTAGGLVAALTPAIDVFIVAEQELGGSAAFPTTAATWEPTLRTFLSAGGVVIVTTFLDAGWMLVDRPGMLIDIGGVSSLLTGMLSVVPAAATHPLAAGVLPYAPSSGTCSYTGVLPGAAISVTPIVQDGAARIVVYDALF